jgi:hypothetical protein
MKISGGVFPMLENNVGELYRFACRKTHGFISPKFKIMFSKKDDWETPIRYGFRYTRHELSFENFCIERIQNYDIIVPLTIPDIKFLIGVRQLISNNPIPIPSMDSLDLCDDKERFNSILVENNFGNYIPKMLNEPQYPYILKKKEDQFGINSHIIINSQQERQWLEKISNPDYFKQQLIPGQREYATHLLYSKGQIVNSLTIEYFFDAEYYIKGKNREISRQKVKRCPYLNIFSSILGFIGFEGLCCINFKIIDSQPLIFEINPRFGGSLSPHFHDFIKGLFKDYSIFNVHSDSHA